MRSIKPETAVTVGNYAGSGLAKFYFYRPLNECPVS